MTQCLDERSGLAKGALEMLPNVLSIAMTQTGGTFQFLDDLFSSLFLVLRNKRSKDLTATADECCIQCVDMMMDWHEHGELDNEVLLEICCIFRDNTAHTEQKHDRVRERCLAYFGFILYGIRGLADSPADSLSPSSPDSVAVDTPFRQIAASRSAPVKAMSKQLSASSMASIEEDGDEEEEEKGLALLAPSTSNHAHAKSADFAAAEEEEEWVPSPRRSFVGQSEAFKMSKAMKRRYLLDGHAQFVAYLKEAVTNGLEDKSAESRQTAFKLLERLERDKVAERLEIDALALSKFRKWKQRKANKKRRKKKSSKSGFKARHAQRDRNQSVTITLGAQ